MHDLPGLLGALDPQAGLVQRHLWLIDLFRWIRGDCRSVPAATARVGLLVDALQSRPAELERLQAWWQALVDDVDCTSLLADFGFASRHAFVSELAERVRLKLLPATPETLDACELFSLVLNHPFDALWLSALEPLRIRPIAHMLGSARPTAGAGAAPGLGFWEYNLLEALTFCTSQVRSSGFSPELRLRMSAPARDMGPFHSLAADCEAVCRAYVADVRLEGQPDDGAPPGGPALHASVQQFRERLDSCRHAASTVYTHLDAHGISVSLVFRLRQMRERVLRIRALLDCLLSADRQASTLRLLAHLVSVGQERRSLRMLLAANSSLLAAKVAERSAESAEHYITRNATEYRAMLRQAAGGGALTALTTAAKFMLLAIGLSAFWNGVWAALVYAASFVAIQLLHWTLATKQPAMTAVAMAAKLKDLGHAEALRDFVDEVTHLVRSQVAAVLGNVGVVFPAVLLLSGAAQLFGGSGMISADAAHHVLQSLTLLGPTLLFAAFTGVLLFACSLVAGWAENWFVLHRLDSAVRYNPAITARLGPERAGRWARFLRDNISGFASNISLGLMLGLIPAFAGFFGLGLDVRHVTLSAGQLAAACAALGWQVLGEPALWWCLAAVPLIGALNLGVSFYLAFRLALRAHNIHGVERRRIRVAIRRRWRQHPLRFFWPAPDTGRSDK